MADAQRGSSVDFRLASALFFISGALGLGYQLVWIRKAALVVGSSQIALATVVTSFFIGLGLGSLVVGRYLRSHRRSPLFVYGLFEVAIGIFAFCFPLAFGWVEGLYGFFYPFVEASGTGLFALRFLLLLFLFIIPTFFMGGTLPLLLDGLVKRDESIGSTTSFLYGLNVLGAVAGVLLTSYYAIPSLGMDATSFYAGCGNLALGLIAVAHFRDTVPLHASEEPARPKVNVLLVSLAFLSGFAAIGYQIVWARYFSLVFDTTVHLVAMLLAVYLLALATGSMLIAPLLARRVAPLRILAIAQALIPLFVVSSIEGWRHAELSYASDGPVGSWELVANWSFVSESIDAVFFAPFFQVALVVFLPVALMGMGLPLLIAFATNRGEDLRPISGSLVFWNTLGSSAGGFVGGYILIPQLGMEGAFIGLGLVSIVLSIAAEWKLRSDRADVPVAHRRFPIGYALSVAGLASLVLFSNGDLTKRTIELTNQGTVVDTDELIDIVEGALTTAWVYSGPTTMMVGAGTVMLGRLDHGIPSSQAVQGHLPVLLYPGKETPKRALGICLGTGQSFGALLMYGVEELDVVDISPEMTALSLKHFAPYNHGLGTDDRVRFHLDDGRHFINRSPDNHYDVISMEPPPPTHAGVYSLYSMEFYREASRALRDGGVLMQWLPLYLMTPMDAAGIIKTQAAVFPNTFVVRTGIGDFMTISYKGDELPRLSTEQIKQRAATFEKERNVAGKKWTPRANYEIASLEGILALITMSPDDLEQLGDAMIYHDDDQRLSYSSGDRQLFRKYNAELLNRLSFAAVPLTPFRKMQKYFIEPLDIDILEDERSRSLNAFGIPRPSRLARLEHKYKAAADGLGRQDTALTLSKLLGNTLDVDRSLLWLERAIMATTSPPSTQSLAEARSITLAQAEFHSPKIEELLDRIPEAFRYSQLAHAVKNELSEYRDREKARRNRYLFPN